MVLSIICSGPGGFEGVDEGVSGGVGRCVGGDVAVGVATDFEAIPAHDREARDVAGGVGGVILNNVVAVFVRVAGSIEVVSIPAIVDRERSGVVGLIGLVSTAKMLDVVNFEVVGSVITGCLVW